MNAVGTTFGKPHILAVRAVVPDKAERAAFDAWYSREHLPDAMKSFGCERAWRCWSEIDPSVHVAMYAFPDRVTLDAANGGEEMKRLVRDFDRDWPGVRRSREILAVFEEIG